MSVETARPGGSQTAAANEVARSCGSCTLCCKLFDIRALNKPQFKWCMHCAVGQGCRIYAQRPDECREFNCSWLTDSSIGDEWKPLRSRIVLTREKGVIGVHVDPSRADAWRKEPYHAQIRAWAAGGADHVIVWEGPDAIALLPRGDKRLGKVPAGHHIAFRILRDPLGKAVLDAVIVAPAEAAFDPSFGSVGGNKDQADAFFSVGLAAAGEGDHQRAIDHFGRAVAKDPKLHAAYDSRAVSLLQLGRLDDAVADARRAAELAPTDAGVINNLALILCAAGRLEEGMAAFDAVLRLDPRYVRAFFNRGNARVRTGDFVGALADFDRALEIDPSYLPARTERGVLRFAAAQFADAAADFTLVAKLEPNSRWQLWLHVARMRAGARDSARVGNDDGDAGLALLAKLLRGDASPAEVAAAMPQDDPDGPFFLGQFHLMSGNPAAAAPHFRRSVEIGRDWAHAADCAAAELRRLSAAS